MDELYRKYRPTSFAEVHGQSGAVKQLKRFIKKGNLPHALLFTGESGTGKTTLARILQTKIDCSKFSFFEYNTADFRGIDLIRDIRKQMNTAAMRGKTKIYYLDECQKMTNDAQNSLLKMLEDTPKHVYFILASTDPQKIIKAIKTRCTEIKTQPLDAKSMTTVLDDICSKEKVKIGEDVRDKIIKVSAGSGRKALVILQQVLTLDDEEEQLELIESADCEAAGIKIAQALMNPRNQWGDMCKILKACKEDAESLRYLILGYAKSTLLGSGKMTGRAFKIITCFSDNFYDSKDAGLAASCYEVICLK